jgi:hypothetical protein
MKRHDGRIKSRIVGTRWKCETRHRMMNIIEIGIRIEEIQTSGK